MYVVFSKKTSYNVTKCLLDHNNNFDYKRTWFDTKMHFQMPFILW